MASIYDTAGQQQETGLQSYGTGNMWSSGNGGLHLGAATNALFGGQNEWRAETPWLDTTQSAAAAQNAQAMIDQQRQNDQQLRQQMGGYSPGLAAGNQQMQQPIAARGLSPQLASQLNRQAQAQDLASQQMLRQQMQQQAARELVASQQAQQQQIAASQQASIQEALANQQAAERTAEQNRKIAQGNASRESSGFGSVLKGIGKGLSMFG